VGRREYAVFSAIRREAAADPGDVESLLVAASCAGDDAVGALAAVMADTLESSLLFIMDRGMPSSLADEYKVLATGLARASRLSNDISIVTVNYDVCADVAIHDAGRHPYYCLNTQRGPRPGEITLAKLHGSLNWHGCSGYRCGYINAEPHVDDFARAHLQAVADGTTLNLRFRATYVPRSHSCGRAEQQPLIVPPVPNKEAYYGDMRVICDRAEHEVREADHILIVGYSFRSIDGAVNRLLTDAVRGRAVRMMVANPCEEARTRTIHALREVNPAINAEEGESFLAALDCLLG
jgi:hypothetical protein